MGRVVLFQEQAIRRLWPENEWWFSVVDVRAVLAGSVDAGTYWRKLKQRMIAETGQPVTFCHGLKLTAPDGKQRLTDCANAAGLFRIIESIPSPKAEPFKRWLAGWLRAGTGDREPGAGKRPCPRAGSQVRQACGERGEPSARARCCPGGRCVRAG